MKKGDNANYDIKLNIKKSVNAPQQLNAKIGVATIVKDGKIIGEVDIVLKEEIQKQNFNDIVNKVVKNWSIL